MVDGRAWVFMLARDGRERQLLVVVTHEALTVDPLKLLPVQTREAIQTDGRSEAARVAQFDDPASCVVLGSGVRRHRVRPDNHGVGDMDHLVDRQVGRSCVATDRLRASGLVDAHSADAPVIRLSEDVASNPAHVLGHPIPFGRRTSGSRLQILGRPPAAATQNDVRLHRSLLGRLAASRPLQACRGR